MENGVLGERIRSRMKPSHEWNEQDILQLIEGQVEESIQLEYKGSASLQSTDEKKKEISKDVSAFANSSGGTIIYGVAEYDEKTKRHLPERIDGGYGPSGISKEWATKRPLILLPLRGLGITEALFTIQRRSIYLKNQKAGPVPPQSFLKYRDDHLVFHFLLSVCKRDYSPPPSQVPSGKGPSSLV